ncbi:hypothetical protein EVAR_91507_1 [Eumeta japonica]|uniref:Uncharacterized protein n=1 Tax=Eumeta variegata TaxID=151549 RepID=A0A4C1VB30_EUMVA|nr:hypothetical protein EVAR_91507_1 [Eumeta japonica]
MVRKKVLREPKFPDRRHPRDQSPGPTSIANHAVAAAGADCERQQIALRRRRARAASATPTLSRHLTIVYAADNENSTH